MSRNFLKCEKIKKSEDIKDIDFGLLLRYYFGLIELFFGGIYDKKN